MIALGRGPFSINRLSVLSCLLLTAGILAQSAQIQERKLVVSGWHTWYEVKADPANPSNVLLCGSRWDSRLNAQYGFVAISTDGGQQWRNVFEDRATAWVGEQSCAFGQNHEMYFISEASRVIDGFPHHEKGVARLFISRDAGLHWTQAAETGWADYSSSAVSATTGDLVTFFNDGGTNDKARNWGSTVGALVFPAKGGQISGPYAEPQMQEHNYQGVMPSQAIALKDGSIAALFGGAKNTFDGLRYELGFERVELGKPVRVTDSIIATNQRCFTLDGHGLLYHETSHQLLVAYSDESPGGGCHLAVAASADNGKTWTKKMIANAPADSAGPLNHISLASGANGNVGVLWEDAGRWLFAILKNGAAWEPAVELSRQPPELQVTDDSLMTFVLQPKSFQIDKQDATPVATVNVRSLPGVVLRSTGLFASRGCYQAIIPLVRNSYEGLEMVTIAEKGEPNQKSDWTVSAAAGDDVTSQVVLLNGRMQAFDKRTGTLSVELRLANRGDRPIAIPIRIEATAISSSTGPVAILNADNGVRGPGAIWDISRVVTGNQLPPGTATYNCFRLSFHLDLKDKSKPTDNFLNLKVRVLASRQDSREVSNNQEPLLHHGPPH